MPFASEAPVFRSFRIGELAIDASLWRALVAGAKRAFLALACESSLPPGPCPDFSHRSPRAQRVFPIPGCLACIRSSLVGGSELARDLVERFFAIPLTGDLKPDLAGEHHDGATPGGLRGEPVGVRPTGG